MKIAMFHELHAGGARRSVNEFGKRLKKKHTVDLYLIDDTENEKEKEFFSSSYLFAFTPRKWSGGNWKAKLYKDTIELYILYKLHRKIADIINSRNYDVVFLDPSRFTQAPFLLRFLKGKTVYYCQEPLRMVYEKQLDVKKDLPLHKYVYEKINRFIRKHIDRSNLSFASIILANSHFSAKNIDAIYNVTSKVSYMGVNTDVFKPTQAKKSRDILFIGSYADDDGYPLVEEAQKYLAKDIKVTVLASEKQWITSDNDIRDLYCTAKIALALGHNEPFGLIPIEAMSCGVPVIAVDEGGYKETVVNDKSGYLIPRDAKILAEKINYLLSHPSALKKMGEFARKEMVSNWDWDKQTKSLENFL